MKGILYPFCMALICLAIPVFAQWAGHTVISEIRYDERSGMNEEFVELYNPGQDTVFLENFSLQYKSKTGTSWRTKVTFTADHTILPFGFFLWGGHAVIPLPDVAEDNQSAVGLSNSGGHIALFDDTDQIIDLVGWEGAETPEGNSDAGKTDDGGSLERKASAESSSETMQIGGEDALKGNGYDTDDNGSDFVVQDLDHVQPQNSQSAREPDPDAVFGAGNAMFFPGWAFGGSTVELRLVIQSGPEEIQNKIGIIPPWELPLDENTISVQNDAAGAVGISVSGDTLILTPITIPAYDSISVRFHTIQIPPDAGMQKWSVCTGKEMHPIENFPSLEIESGPVDMAALHANDIQGIPLQLDARVCVRGIVTAGTGIFAKGSTDIYLQDRTGGIKIYAPDAMVQFVSGDSVTLIGRVQQFRGMTELVPEWDRIVVHSHGNDIPEPIRLTCEEINESFASDDTEPNEARLVEIQNVIHDASASTLSDSSGECQIYLDPDAEIVMASGKLDVIGILTQYKPGTTDPGPPYDSDYCIQPRYTSDIIPLTTLQFIQAPVISGWYDDGVTLSFKTSESCHTIIDYGISESYSDQTEGPLTTDHLIRISGLEPATIYHYRITCGLQSDEIRTVDDVFVTKSTSAGSEEVQVYFNGSVDLQDGFTPASGEQDLYDRLVERIQAAQYSIDACFMKLTDWDIRDALIEAKQHGIKVRFICDQDEFAQPEIQSLMDAGIPVISDAFGDNAGDGIMHHKFAVFDHRDISSYYDDWIWTGSFNPTYYGSYPQPYENVVVIQDAALAAVYTRGFEIMWGSTTDTANAGASQFSGSVFSHLPHQLMMDSTLIEVYFSPDGDANKAIENALLGADHSLAFCMFSFTRDNLANAVIDRSMESDFLLQGLLDGEQIMSDDPYTQWPVLSGSCPSVICRHTESRTLHHKYAVIDVTTRDSDPSVITGSYNWTNSAETRNNENVIIIHSSQTAEQYQQEFNARYMTAGIAENMIAPVQWQLQQNYPNPFNSLTRINFSVPVTAQPSIYVIDVRGQIVKRFSRQLYTPGNHTIQWDGCNDSGISVSSGVYILCFESTEFINHMKMIILK